MQHELLARCHHRLRQLSAALQQQRLVCQWRPSISNLLMLAGIMKDKDEEDEEHREDDDDDDEQQGRRQRARLRERADVLLRCIELCPVHAQAWHRLAELFLELAATFPAASSSSLPLVATDACSCSRLSSLSSARLCFSLVHDLCNFTQDGRFHWSGDGVPTLSLPLYSALLSSASQQLSDLSTLLPPLSSAPAQCELDSCPRCNAVCCCWQARLHGLACRPLFSLFSLERLAEQRGTEGEAGKKGKMGRRQQQQQPESRRGERGDAAGTALSTADAEGAADSDAEDAADDNVDRFDALQL